MGKEPDQIRQDIEDTRARMGETVEAIGYKADVPARARESVAGTKDQVVRSVAGVKDRVVGSIVGTKESVGGSMSNAGSSITGSVGSAGQTVADSGRSVAGKVADMTPSSQDLRQGVQRSAGLAQENPLGLAFGSIAVGFIAGLMVPATRVERQNIGPVADQIVDKAREAGQEAADRGKQVAQEAAQTARQVAEETLSTAQEAAQHGVDDLRGKAQEHGQDLASSAQEKASELTGSSSGGEREDESQQPEASPSFAGHPGGTEAIPSGDRIGGSGVGGTYGTIEGRDPGGTPTI